MLNGIMPVGVAIVAPKNERSKNPWVLDESVPKTRDPQEVMYERMLKRDLKKAKKKPVEERNVFDYLLLAQDHIKKNPHVIFMA